MTEEAGETAYLVESYRPGASREEVRHASRRLAAAAAALARRGEPVRFRGSTFLPGEESCFHRFSGGSADVVARVCAAAQVQAAHIHEVIDLEEERCES